jgi:hypothetical protein
MKLYSVHGHIFEYWHWELHSLSILFDIDLSSETIISLKVSLLLLFPGHTDSCNKSDEEMSSSIKNYDTPAPCNDLQKTLPAEERIGCSPRTAMQLSVVLRWGWTDSQIFFFWTWKKYINHELYCCRITNGNPFLLKKYCYIGRIHGSGQNVTWFKVYQLSRLNKYIIFTSITINFAHLCSPVSYNQTTRALQLLF